MPADALCPWANPAVHALMRRRLQPVPLLNNRHGQATSFRGNALVTTAAELYLLFLMANSHRACSFALLCLAHCPSLPDPVMIPYLGSSGGLCSLGAAQLQRLPLLHHKPLGCPPPQRLLRVRCSGPLPVGSLHLGPQSLVSTEDSATGGKERSKKHGSCVQVGQMTK